jgi:hypothetical protein
MKSLDWFRETEELNKGEGGFKNEKAKYQTPEELERLAQEEQLENFKMNVNTEIMRIRGIEYEQRLRALALLEEITSVGNVNDVVAEIMEKVSAK